MPDPIISADNVSKMYQLGLTHEDFLANKFLNLFTGLFRSSEKKTRSREELWALKNVSFDIYPGEVVGIIGRNGAGKSTLLKVLSRITEPSEGEIRIKGRVASLLEVGTGFHPELTGKENIYLNGAILGMTKDEIDSKFDQIVEFAEISQFVDTPVKRYSSGMYVRLAFSVAAHIEPEILIVDEVLAVGDARFQKKCLGKMDEVAKQGRTVLFVSHNMAAVEQLCHKGLLIQAGEISYFGEVHECTKKYLGAHKGTVGHIVDHITKNDQDIDILSIMANDSPSDSLVVAQDVRSITVEITGTLSRAFRLDFEARLCDVAETAIAYFSPGVETGELMDFPAGEFTISRTFPIPSSLMRGEYYLTMHLVNPNVYIPAGLKFIYEGTPTAGGKVMEYNKENGWFFLS
jgi:lipopolysaccharide transport system ATP-binding protein